MLLRPSEPLGRWRRRGCHIMRLHRLPRSETARHHEAEFALPIEEEEEEEPLCIDSPLCPGPWGSLSVAVYEDSDSRDSIGSIPFHHKELAEHLRSDLHAKQHGELCERVGEQNLFTT
jgi:hypothetical protein